MTTCIDSLTVASCDFKYSQLLELLVVFEEVNFLHQIREDFVRQSGCDEGSAVRYVGTGIETNDGSFPPLTRRTTAGQQAKRVLNAQER